MVSAISWLFPCVVGSSIEYQNLVEHLTLHLHVGLFSSCCCRAQYPDKSNLKERGLFWLTVWECGPSWQGCRGGQGLRQLVTYVCLRKQRVLVLCELSPFCAVQDTSPGKGGALYSGTLPTWVNLIKVVLHSSAWRLVSLIADAIKLMITQTVSGFFYKACVCCGWRVHSSPVPNVPAW